MEEAPIIPEPIPSNTDSQQLSSQQLEESQELIKESSIARASSTQSEEPKSMEAPVAEDDEEPPLKKVRKEKKSKGKTLLSAELYRSMTAMIGLILKTKQEQAEADGDGNGGDYGGCRWGDLVAAYLAQVNSPFPLSSSLHRHKMN